MADRTLNLILKADASGVSAAETALKKLIDAEARLSAASKERAKLEQLSGKRGRYSVEVQRAREAEKEAINQVHQATIGLYLAEKQEATAAKEANAETRRRMAAMAEASAAIAPRITAEQALAEATRIAANAERAHQSVIAASISSTQASITLSQQYQAAVANLTHGVIIATEDGRMYNRVTREYVSASDAAKIAVQTQKNELAGLNRVVEQSTASLTKKERALLSQRVATAGLNNTIGSGTIALVSFGQIIQDSSQFGMGFAQGMRAVTNNIQSFATAIVYATASAGSLTKAMQAMWTAVKGPFGVLLAVSFLSSALELMSNRSMKSTEKTKELTNALNGLIFVVGAGSGGQIYASLHQLSQASQQYQGRVSALRKEKEELRKQFKTIDLDVYQKELGRIDEAIALNEKYQSSLTEIIRKKKEESEQRAFGNSLISQEDQATNRLNAELEALQQNIKDAADAYRISLVPAIRAYQRELEFIKNKERTGLDEGQFNRRLEETRQRAQALGYAGRLTKEEFAKLFAELGSVEAVAQRLSNKTTEAKKDELSILEKLILAHADLNDEILQWTRDGARITAEENEIRYLEYRLELLQTTQRLAAIGLPMVVPAGLKPMGEDQVGIEAQAWGSLSSLQERMKALPAGVPKIDREDLEWVERYREEYFAATDAIIDQSIRLEQSVEQAMEGVAISFAAGIGAMLAGSEQFDSIGKVAMSALGDMLVQLGQVAIAEGIALTLMREALQNFLKSPWAPVALVAAGAGLIALGSYIGAKTAAISKGKPSGSAGGGGGGGYSGGTNNLLGATGALSGISQRGSIFSPEAASAYGAIGFVGGGSNRVYGELTGSGRSLVAVIKDEVAAQKRMGVRDPLGVSV